MYLQPISFVRVTNPRKASHEVVASTRRRRSVALSSIRKTMSGGEKGAERQLAHEIEHTNRETRLGILEKAGIRPHIPEGEGLAMRADLSMPWYRLRQLRR